MTEQEQRLIREMQRDISRLGRQVATLTNLLRTSVTGLMDIRSAALYMGYEKGYLYQLARSGKIPCYRPTKRKVMFRKEELDRWIMGYTGD